MTTEGRRTVTNTKSSRPGLDNYTRAQIMGPAGIEAMEKQGIDELVASDVLPTDVRFNSRLAFEQLGFVFGEVVEGDPLFQYVTMPAGWTRKSNRARSVSILDDKGRERVSVHYKAAFYDRRATMHLTNRYVTRPLEEDLVADTDDDPRWELVDRATDVRLFLGTHDEAEARLEEKRTDRKGRRMTVNEEWADA